MLFGKPVSELQTGVVVGDTEITGTLHYVTNYTEFSSESDEQAGNYIALKFDTDISDGVVTTVEIVGGTKGPVTLDSDMNWVGLIRNKDTQSIRVISKKNTTSETKTYDLTGLTLETEE